MKRNGFSLIVLFISLSISLLAQNETNNWYFGYQAALNFSTNPPTILLNSAMNAGEGSSSISDASGNLLFYTNGVNVWNNSHNIMANGSGLLGNQSTTQSSLIVKQPGNTNIYYLFTQDDLGGPDGLRYSIIDMSLAVGQGSVTLKNILLQSPSCEKIAATKHCNGRDVWVISHDFNSAQFRVYLLSNTGISTLPVISSIGSTISNTLETGGYLKVSPNGRKIAAVVNGTVQVGRFELFDFDNSTGVLSNSLAITDINFPYGCEFSPDGTIFYGTNFVNSQIMQWNLCAGSEAAIISSSYAISTGTVMNFAMQLANNGKIYVSHGGTTANLSVINSPNSIGSAMAFSFGVQSTTPNIANLGLPNFMNNYPAPLSLVFTHSITCSSVNFVSPITPTVAATCSVLSVPFSSYFWDFGEPSSGASNTSTLSNPSHIYSATGTYTCSLIVQSNCSTDTIRQQINISSVTPVFALIGPTVICVGEKAVITASGIGSNTYSWSAPPLAGNVSSVQLNPSVTSQYTVTATNTTSACKYSRVFQLKVDKCQSLKSERIYDDILIYPIPAQDELVIEVISNQVSNENFEIQIFDQNSQLIFKSLENRKQIKIDLSSWSQGFYVLKLKIGEKHYYKKLLLGHKAGF